MKKRFDIKQNTVEWLEAKWRKIGGTKSKGLFVDSNTLLIELLGQYLEEFEPDDDGFQSDAMKNGTEMEPFGIQYLEGYTGLIFDKPGIIESVQYPILCLSPDGITPDNTVGAEVKCLQRKAHTSILYNNKTPDEYIPQIVHNFTINPKLRKMYFIAFRPQSTKHFIEEFTLDSEVDFKWKKKTEIKQFSKRDGVTPIQSTFETSADIKTIREWAEIGRKKAAEIQEILDIEVTKLSNTF